MKKYLFSVLIFAPFFGENMGTTVAISTITIIAMVEIAKNNKKIENASMMRIYKKVLGILENNKNI